MLSSGETAVRFLRALDPYTSTFNLRSFPDKSSGDRRARSHSAIKLGDVSALVEECEAKELGLFLVVNDGGQTTAEIKRVRALFVDIDRKDFGSDEECEAAMRQAHEGRGSPDEPIPNGWPHCSLVVRSGGGGFHLYWIVDDCPLDRFTSVQKALARKFSADLTCTDLPRVMRLPGSVHMKGHSTRVELVKSAPERRYALSDLLLQLELATDVEDPQIVGESPRCHEDPADDPVFACLLANPQFLKEGGRRRPNSPVDVVCPNEDRHSLPDSISSTVYMPHGMNGIPRGFHCSHSHCIGLTLGDFLHNIGYDIECPEFNSDDGLACRFVDWLNGRVMYSRGHWYIWDRSHWRMDEGAVRRLLKEFAHALSRKVLRSDGHAAGRGDSAAGRRLRTALALLNEPRQGQVLKSAATMLLVGSESLDQTPDLLTVPNGSVNLATGELSSAVPSDYSTLCAGVAYDPSATSPRWDQFLNEVFLGNQEIVQFVQRFIGYCLTGHMREEVMVVGYGHGANGKSVLAEVLRDIFGGYAVTADPSLITSSRVNAGSATPDSARLAGKRFCLLNESKVGDRIDDGMVKKLVSTEKMVARALYRDPFEFYPTAKLFLRTNHRPLIRDDSEGMWRRLYLLPFGAHFPEASRDLQLLSKLRSEKAGILASAVRGAMEWYRIGLRPPAAITEASNTYRSDQDEFGAWFQDRTEPGEFTATAALIDDYLAYTGGRSKPAVPLFSSRLKESGAVAHRRQHARGFRLALKPPGNDAGDLW